jgi:hypothetical protein
VKRLTKSVLGGVAGCALILGATQAANGVSTVTPYGGGLVDYELADGPLDGATGSLRVTSSAGQTGFKFSVKGIDPSAAGKEIGAHLHTGPCVVSDYAIPDNPDTRDINEAKAAGWQAGPHYNHDRVLGDLPPDINTKTEVWFDLIPNARGAWTGEATVSFKPVDSTLIPGVMSIVIHVLPTDPKTGGAGDRQACLPLNNVSAWAKTTL